MVKGKKLQAGTPSNNELTRRLVGIIRRDLRVGAEFELAPDTKLFGGDLDLDSLDALLLLQSIERELGVKVHDNAVDPAVFTSVETLSDFVMEQSRQQPNA